jgi:hypothetical protein
MRKLPALAIASLLLTGCSARQMPWANPAPLPQASIICPAWVDRTAAPAVKRKLAAELRAAPDDAQWPDVVVEASRLTDQLQAAGCKPAAVAEAGP